MTLSTVILGLDPIGAKIEPRVERHRSLFVMVGLDPTIGVLKIALTRVFVPMVRPGRTMTREGRCLAGRGAILAPMGLDPRIGQPGYGVRRTTSLARREILGSSARMTRIKSAMPMTLQAWWFQ